MPHALASAGQLLFHNSLMCSAAIYSTEEPFSHNAWLIGGGLPAFLPPVCLDISQVVLAWQLLVQIRQMDFQTNFELSQVC